MGIIEVLNNWLEERKVKSEKRRLDKQDLRLKELQSKENIKIKKLESQNQKAEQTRILKEAAIKSSAAIKIKKLEARTEKYKSNASKPGFFENLSLSWEKRGERRKAIKLAKIEENKAAKPGILERFQDSYEKWAERRHEAKESKMKMFLELEKAKIERTLEEKRIKATKPNLWEQIIKYFKKTPAPTESETVETHPKKASINTIIGWSLGSIIFMFLLLYTFVFKDSSPEPKQDSTTDSLIGELYASSDMGINHFHHAGTRIKIGKSGYLYKRTAGYTYSETTADHIVYVPVNGGKKFFVGPNGYESEKPGGDVINTPSKNNDYLLFPNENYGTKEAIFEIVSIKKR